jgi:hypothetical protein
MNDELEIGRRLILHDLDKERCAYEVPDDQKEKCSRSCKSTKCEAYA